MDLRYRLAVVTGAGHGLGQQVAVALGRAGAAVLAVDADLRAAEATAVQVRDSRVSAWALQADPAEEPELQLVADRARDLGGMDLLVTCVGGPDLAPTVRLTRLFLAGLADRRGRRDGTPAVVIIGSGPDLAAAAAVEPAGVARVAADLAGPADAGAGARVMAVLHRPGPGADEDAATTRAVVELLRGGAAGQVVEVGGGSLQPPGGSR